jgi:hypothetical protein
MSPRHEHRPFIACVFAAILLVLGVIGCRSDEEKAADTARNFLSSDRVHAAPYRSYLFISQSDHETMTMEEYAAWHPYEPLPSSTPVEVIRVAIEDSRATVDAEVGGSEERVVMVREANRWRVHLGLADYTRLREHLDSARAAVVRDDLDEAMQEIVQAGLIKSSGTLGSDIRAEIAELRSYVEAREEKQLIERQFAKGLNAPLDQLEPIFVELERIAVAPVWDEEWKQLRQRREDLRTEAARKGLVFADVKVRRFYEGPSLVHELDVVIRNESPVGVSSVDATLDMLQRDESLGVRDIELTMEKTLAPGQERAFTVRVPDTPVAWKSRDARLEVATVETAHD